MPLNVNLLREAVEWVKAEADKPADESKWDQSHWAVIPREDDDEKLTWSCGTKACLAGHVVQLAGYKPVIEGAIPSGDVIHIEKVASPDDPEDTAYIESLACELLGIEQGNPFIDEGLPHLFEGDNSVEDIVKVSDRLIEEYA